jgi:protein phosphatase
VRYRAGARTDVGKIRSRNEDSYLVDEPLFIVADGMGGHRGGNVASALTVETIRDAAPDWGAMGSELTEAIRRANRVVFERSAGDKELHGMGTTVTVLQTGDRNARIVHVGDSRAYLFREGALQQLTDDHTLVQQMVNDGKISSDEAAHHPARNIVTRGLGLEKDVRVDELTLDVHPGDRVMLCSDGLTGMVDDDAIRQILEREPDPQAAAEALVELAVERGGEDNVTVIVVDVLEGDGDESGADAGAAAGEGATAIVGGAAARGEGNGDDADGDDAQPASDRSESGAPSGGAAPAPPRRRLFPWRRLLVWAAAIAVVVAAAATGVRLYVDRQWYVGEQDGRVAVFNGIPAKPLGISLSKPEEITEISASDAERLGPWRGLAQGITADSREAAASLVTQIRQDVAAVSAPTGSSV